MLTFIFILIGTVIIIASFILYNWFIGFAHGMNVTGCGSHCSIQWRDFFSSDALIFYIPAAFGLMIIFIGIYIYYRQKKNN